MSRTLLKGMLLGAVFTALVCLGLVRALAKPAYVDLTGLVLSDSTSHPDSRMNNRIFLTKIALEEPAYIRSKTIDINDLDKLVDQSVRLRGEFRPLTLTTGETVLELEVKDVLKTNAPE